MTYTNSALCDDISRISPAISSLLTVSEIIDSQSYRDVQREKIFEELWDVYDECKNEGWDGYGAQPVSVEDFEISFEFLKLLVKPSLGIKPPEIAADPDGEITFEWYEENGSVFAVGISAHRKLSYAGILTGKKIHGTENFGVDIPPVILCFLLKHFSQLIEI